MLDIHIMNTMPKITNQHTDQISTWTPFKNDIHGLLACVKYKNISKASERVGMTQASLSKLIVRIEDGVGFKIFDRLPSGIRLTNEGQALVEGLEKLNLYWKNDILDANFLSESQNINLSFGCHKSVASDNFSKFVPTIVNKNITINFIFEKSVEVTRLVSNKVIDLGLVINPIKNPDLIVKTIKTEFVGIWGKVDAPNLYHNPELFMGERILKSVKDKNLIPIPDYEIIAELVKNNNLSGLLPSTVAQKYNLPLISGKLMSVQLCLICHKDLSKNLKKKNVFNQIAKLL